MLHFNISPVTALLVDHLSKVPFGGQIAYADLPPHDVGNLQSARRILVRDYGAVFAPVRGFGLRRLNADEASVIGKNQRRKIRKSAHKAVKEMTAMVAKTNDLTDAQRLEVSREIAHNGLLGYLATERTAEIIKQKPILADTARADVRLLNALIKDA